MFTIRAVDILNAKVVNNQREGDGTSLVFEETGCVFRLVVARGREMFDEPIVGNFAGLWEAIHAFTNLDVNVAIVDFVREVVLVHDCFGYEVDWDAHVLVLCHGSFEVEVLDVGSEELGVWGRKNAVKEDFGRCEICSFGADVAVVDNSVAPDGESNAFLDCFVGFVGGNNAQVGGFATSGNVRDVDEVHGVGACRHVGKISLGEAAYFVGSGRFPGGAFRAVSKCFVFGVESGIGVNGAIGGVEPFAVGQAKMLVVVVQKAGDLGCWGGGECGGRV